MGVVENLWALARSENPVNVEIGRSMAASVGCPADEYEEAVKWKRCQCDMCKNRHSSIQLTDEPCFVCGARGHGHGVLCPRCSVIGAQEIDLVQDFKYKHGVVQDPFSIWRALQKHLP